MTGVLYSVFDPGFPAASNLYKLFEKTLGAIAPCVLFAGNPLPDLPHPVITGAKDRERQLRDHWTQLTSFLKTIVVPALTEGRMVFLDGCSLNVFLSAAAMADPEECVQLEKLHRRLEDQRFKRLRLPRPYYILEHATVDREVEHARFANPSVRECSERKLERCARRVHALLHPYFGKGTKQQGPYWIPLAERTPAEIGDLCRKQLRVPLAA